MDFLPLLGLHLKSDEIIELLELLDMEVVYDFDSLHENTPDVYWASATTEGFQLRFDEAQVLKNIFLYVVADEGFEQVNQDDCDVTFFSELKQVESHAVKTNLQITKGKSNLFGIAREWIRLEGAEHSVHYKFRGSELARVTLSSSSS